MTCNGYTINDNAKLVQLWENGIIGANEVLATLADTMTDEQLQEWQDRDLIDMADGSELF